MFDLAHSSAGVSQPVTVEITTLEAGMTRHICNTCSGSACTDVADARFARTLKERESGS